MEGKISEEEVKEDKPAEEVEASTPAEESTDAPEPEPEPEAEDNTMTFAEYMASKGKKEESAGREVENEFAGKAAAKKAAEEDFLVMGEGKSKKKKKGKETKQALEVGFRVVSYAFIQITAGESELNL